MTNELLDSVLEKLSELPSMDLAELLEDTVKEIPYDSRNQFLLLRLENKPAKRLEVLYTNTELTTLLLQMSFQALPETAKKNGIVYETIHHPCVVCCLKKEPEQFEYTPEKQAIEICKSCFESINKPKLVNYIFRLLDYIDSENAATLYRKLKLKNRHEICNQYTKYELREMIIRLASGFDSIAAEIEPDEDQEPRLIECQAILAEYPVLDITRHVRKFQQGAARKKNEEWRDYVPDFMKKRYSSWETASITDVYNEANALIATHGKPARTALLSFSASLSRIIFDNPNITEVAGEPIYELEEIEEHITAVVEMIMLPHLDVLDQIDDATYGAHFDSLAFEDDRDSLIRRVKNRDHNLCLVCKTTDDIHLHHRIPEKYGNINNLENLVLLCGACREAVRTADLETAIETGISNYNKALGRRLLEQDTTR